MCVSVTKQCLIKLNRIEVGFVHNTYAELIIEVLFNIIKYHYSEQLLEYSTYLF